MSKKRLLILTDRDFVGGAEVNYRFILPALAARGWAARVLTTPGDEIASFFARTGVPAEVVGEMGATVSFSEGGRVALGNVARSMAVVADNRAVVRRHAEDFGATAVVSNGMVSHMLLSMLPTMHPAGPRRVMHLQDIVDRTKAAGGYGLGLDALAARADAIVSISDAVTATLAPRHHAKTVKLYNPLPPVLPSRPTPTPTGVRRVGLFARYTPWKGHRDFLRIAAAFAESPVEFVAFGTVSDDERAYLAELRATAAALPNADRVHLNGFTEDVYPEMAACDVILHLSTAPEPFGRVLIEANACGVPLLAYRGGAVDELFDALGLAGQRFASGDHAGLAAALATFDPTAHPMPDLAALHPDRYAERFERVLLGDPPSGT